MGEAEWKTTGKATRRSGIEALKIIACVLVVFSHVVQTLSSENTYISYNSYVLDLTIATSDIQYIIAQIIRSFGSWGNTLFFVCSAWFLIDSDRYSKKKWLFLLIEIWSVSCIIAIITYIVRQGDVSLKLMLKSFFPTTFSANWYMTCYLLFYPIHPLLNKIVDNINKEKHLRLCIALFVLYYIINFITSGHFFVNNLILWFSLYFIVAYIKKYAVELQRNKKNNIIIFFLSFSLFILSYVFLDIIGLKISYMRDKALLPATFSNPFILICSIALFNLANNSQFRSKSINFISGLSMLIYIIHENMLLRIYFRPLLWNYAYEKYGYDHLLLIILVMTISIFVSSALCAMVYNWTVGKLVKKFSDKLFVVLKRIYLAIECRLLKLIH